MTPASFIAMAAPLAQAGERQYGVPSSVAIAQAILESGWGESRLTKDANNFFGIKCFATVSQWQDGCYEIATTEYNSDGTSYTIIAKFRKYATPERSFIDHGSFLRVNSRYAPAFAYTNYPDRFAVEIHKAGYATDPAYANSLIGIMSTYNLYQYDLATPRTGPVEIGFNAPAKAVAGRAVNVTGVVGPGQPGRKVWTEALVNGAWQVSETRTTSSTRGVFTIPLTTNANVASSVTYRVRSALTDGSTATSATFTLTRTAPPPPPPPSGQPTFTVPSSLRAPAGTYLTARGKLTGVAAGQVVRAEVYTAWWSGSTTATTTADGSFALPLPYRSGKVESLNYRVSAVLPNGQTITSATFPVTRTNPFVLPGNLVANVGATLTLNGKVAGGTTGQRVRAEVYTRWWSGSNIVQLRSDGTFSMPITYAAWTRQTLTYRLVTTMPDGSVLVSPTFTVQRR